MFHLKPVHLRGEIKKVDQFWEERPVLLGTGFDPDLMSKSM
jgi:hypothetical protein